MGSGEGVVPRGRSGGRIVLRRSVPVVSPCNRVWPVAAEGPNSGDEPAVQKPAGWQAPCKPDGEVVADVGIRPRLLRFQIAAVLRKEVVVHVLGFRERV